MSPPGGGGGHAAAPLAAARLAAAPWPRRAILLVVAAGALFAVLSGLARLGVSVPTPALGVDHGPLFVIGVFGTVIALERAVALGSGWAFGGPLLGAACVIALLLRWPHAGWLGAASCAWLVGVNVAVIRRQSVDFTWLMLLASVASTAGCIAWAAGRAVYEVVPLWLAFFVLTIAAERLELSRLAPTPRWAQRLVVALGLALVAAAILTSLGLAGGRHVLGATLAAIGAWQLRFDIAQRTFWRAGLPRYVATGVLVGSCWLLVAGALLLLGGPLTPGPAYDAALHAVLVGFVLSMVFAHALIILPAVARIEVPYTRLLYGPLALLHAGLILRVVGDLAASMPLRTTGALLSAVALAAFALTVLGASLAGRRAAKP